jgi:hypothetical protein
MTEHQWELYRLSVVETWPDSPYKAATIAGIQHRLAAIEHAEALSHAISGDWKPVKKAPHPGRPGREGI